LAETYETRWKVRFGDVDPAGVAFYPTVVRALHDALEDFFGEFVGVEYDRVLTEERLGFPAVGLNVNFFRPLRFGETVILAMSITHLGRSSVRFRYRVRGEDGTERAEAEVTVTTVSLDSFSSVPIPDRYRRVFERVLEPDTEDDVGGA